MTLDEAIIHAETVAERLENSHKRDWMCEDDERCAKEHRQLAAWLKELKQLREQTRWIPVSERLPEAGKEYLCCDANGFMEVGYLSKNLGEWCANGEVYEEVIAWMPCPKPYMAKNEEV